MVKIGSGAQRELTNVRSSRYACYLILQNGNPSKSVIANGQAYFALQTRRQEQADGSKFGQLSKDEKRLAIRNELATHNKQLDAAVGVTGVVAPMDYAINLTSWLLKFIRRFRQPRSPRPQGTEEKLCRAKVKGKTRANKAHFDVGRKVRQTIAELGGSTPESLPKPDNSIAQIEIAQKRLLKKITKESP